MPPSGKLDKMHHFSDCGPFAPLCENMTSSRKPEVQRIALPPKNDRATAKGNMYGKFGIVVLRYKSGQTNRQTYRHADHNTSHTYHRGSN